MKKILSIALMLSLLTYSTAFSVGDIFITRAGHIWFHSATPLETIDGHNYQVSSSLNKTTGDMAFMVLIKGFEFQKALMQEHFNEDYLESTKFPSATFKGKITNIGALNLSKDGTSNATVEGDLTMHGVTKHVTTTGTITVKGTVINAKSSFKVTLADYGITIRPVNKDNIQPTLAVNVDCSYNPK